MVAFLNEEVAYAEENCDLLVPSGDLIDFVSKANVDFARELFNNAVCHQPWR